MIGTDSLWRAITSLGALKPGLNIVVADGTKLFVDALDVQAFCKQGGSLYGYRSIRILGLTLNPFSPMGGSFDGAEFLASSIDSFPGYDVCDVVLNEQLEQGVGLDVATSA